MKLFAIADLHMPGGADKSMDIFGNNWEGHVEKIFSDWRVRVGKEDAVLVPGDISWAMYMEDAIPDLLHIAELPGKKVLLKGNHDYWWSSLTKVKEALPQDMYVIQHSALDLGSCVVCGTRGWICPGCGENLTPEDEKIYHRECIRLELALQEGTKLADGRPIIVMMHYPPLYPQNPDTGFTEILEKYPINYVVYGHLHGKGIAARFEGERHGITYMLTSCDSTDFCLREIPMSGDKNDETISDKCPVSIH